MKTGKLAQRAKQAKPFIIKNSADHIKVFLTLNEKHLLTST